MDSSILAIFIVRTARFLGIRRAVVKHFFKLFLCFDFIKELRGFFGKYLAIREKRLAFPVPLAPPFAVAQGIKRL